MPSIATLLGGSQNKAWAEDKSRFGFKMMKAMGWEEGTGLGKNNDGVLTHVKLKKRGEELGLGSEIEDARNKNFVAQQSDFNSLLASLAEDHVCVTKTVLNKKKKKKKRKKDEKNEKNRSAKKTPNSFRPTRFIANKDVSKYSESDKAALFGVTEPDSTFVDYISQTTISTSSASSTEDSQKVDIEDDKSKEVSQKKRKRASDSGIKSQKKSKKSKKKQ